MENYGCIRPVLEIGQQPIPSSAQTTRINSKRTSSVGAKVKSFRIKPINNSQVVSTKTKGSVRTVTLPPFAVGAPRMKQLLRRSVSARPTTSVPITFPTPPSGRDSNHRVPASELKPSPPVLGKKPWLKCFLLGGGAAMLLQTSSSEARDLLQRARIYLQLDSPAATTISNRARIYLQSNQASGFNRAIREARKVEPNSPFYQEARADIARWSKVILDIAQGRAKQGSFAEAIAAAQLVPQNEPSIRAIAQQANEAIEQWKLQAQQQQPNQVLLAAAKGLINPTQASSYNRAIATLRQISPSEPGYREAQELIIQWSQQIYLTANSRAAKGNFQEAVQTAALVPPDAPYYQAASAAIAKWKQF